VKRHDAGLDADDVKARLELALTRLQRPLSADEIAAIRSQIERQQSVLRQLRSVPLGNGDEPAAGFDPAPWAHGETRS
jgi:hypothetical protein